MSNEFSGYKIKLVCIDNFAKTKKNLAVNQFYNQLLNMKLNGYQERYPDSYIPLDRADFFSKQFLFCLEVDGVSKPFAGIRHVSLKRCDYYHTEFPLLTTVNQSNERRSINYLNSEVEFFRSSETDLIYPCGYTIVKEFTKDRELTNIVRELIGALLYYEQSVSSTTNYVSASVCRFNTFKFVSKYGYEKAFDEKGELPVIDKKSAEGEKLQILHIKKITDLCHENYLKHEKLFKSMLYFGNEPVFSEKNHAA